MDSFNFLSVKFTVTLLLAFLHVVFEAAETFNFIFGFSLDLLLGLQFNFLVTLTDSLNGLVLILSVDQVEVTYHFLAMLLLLLGPVSLRHGALLLDLLQLLLECLLVFEQLLEAVLARLDGALDAVRRARLLTFLILHGLAHCCLLLKLGRRIQKANASNLLRDHILV
jgi:hypothetical protein